MTATITKTQVAVAVDALRARGYSFRHLPEKPSHVWLQAPGEMPGTDWWALWELPPNTRAQLVWALYLLGVEG